MATRRIWRVNRFDSANGRFSGSGPCRLWALNSALLVANAAARAANCRLAVRSFGISAVNGLFGAKCTPSARAEMRAREAARLDLDVGRGSKTQTNALSTKAGGWRSPRFLNALKKQCFPRTTFGKRNEE